MPTYRTIVAVLAFAALATAGKAQETPKETKHKVFGEYIAPQDSFPKLRYFDTGLVSLNDRCAVRKVRLNSKMPPVYVNGQPIGFCWAPCAATFVQGPEPYLRDFHIQLPCAVEPSAKAILDPQHRAFVNHEVYFFSSDAARAQFEQAPYRFTGKVTDPVSLVRFQPTAHSPSRTAAGRLFYFESSKTRAQFDRFPEKYSTPKPTMHETK